MKRIILIILLIGMVTAANAQQTYYNTAPPNSTAIPSFTYRGTSTNTDSLRRIWAYWGGYYNELVTRTFANTIYARLGSPNTFTANNSFNAVVTFGAVNPLTINGTNFSSGNGNVVDLNSGGRLLLSTPQQVDVVSSRLSQPGTQRTIRFRGDTIERLSNLAQVVWTTGNGTNGIKANSFETNDGGKLQNSVLYLKDNYIDGQSNDAWYIQGKNQTFITTGTPATPGQTFLMGYNLRDGATPYNSSYVNLRVDAAPVAPTDVVRLQDVSTAVSNAETFPKDTLITVGGSNTIFFPGISGKVIISVSRSTAEYYKTTNTNPTGSTYYADGTGNIKFQDNLSAGERVSIRYKGTNGTSLPSPDRTVATYAAMIAQGTPTAKTVYRVLSDENKSYTNSTYIWYPDGKRVWVASTDDN